MCCVQGPVQLDLSTFDCDKALHAEDMQQFRHSMQIPEDSGPTPDSSTIELLMHQLVNIGE